MRKFIQSKTIILFFLVLFFSACDSENKITNSNNTNISGYAQKGPFKKESIVKAYKLENGIKTNESVKTTTTDDKGSYKLDIFWSGPTQIEITGEYFDEVTSNYIQNGHLVSIINAKANEEIKSNINILTHIASKNIIETLKKTPNISIDEAKKSAEKSVAKAFSLDLEENSLDELDLTDGEDQAKRKANAQLLKISASILSTDNPEDTLEKISEDIKDDGEINSNAVSVFEDLKTKEENIDLNAISNNLETNLNIDNTPDNTVLDGTLTLHHNIKFTQKTNRDLNTNIESDAITVSGIIGNAKISIQNGLYKIDNNDFTANESTISNGQILKIKHTSANKSDAKNTTTLTIAGVDIEFSSLTKKIIVDIVVSDASYSTKTVTNKNVTVSFTSDMDILTPLGWNKNNNIYSKVYSSNINENVIFQDTYGNSTSKQVEINNIDKMKPNASITYSTTSITNQDVLVTITLSKDVNTLEGWTKNGKVFTKTYSENTPSKTITFTDFAGNSVDQVVIINNIDKTTPVLNKISYSNTKPTNTSVIATFTSNEDLTVPNNWIKTFENNIYIYKRTYESNTNENIFFSDKAGNSISKNILINNIDKIAPIISDAVYSTTDITKENIIITFVSTNTDIITPSGWVKSGNSYIKTYNLNVNENVVFQDTHGNSTSKNVLIENIDKTAPTVSDASYSIKELTNNDVEVTFLSNDSDLVIPNGWVKDNTNIKKTYSNNTNENIVFVDNAGNSTNKQVVINNIDKVKPTASISYSSSKITDQDVLVTITLSKEVKPLEGWTKSGKVFTKTYSENTPSKNITFTDFAGNSISKKILINNIDKIAPIVSDAIYSETSITKESIVVTFSSKDTDIITPNGWIKEGENYTKTYSLNINEDINFIDNAGNKTSKNINITNIDKIAPIINNAVYSNTNITNENVTVTFLSNSDDIITPGGWTKTTNIFSKTYTSNINENVKFIDNAGNEIVKNISITNIDKTAPLVSNASYSITSSTNQDIRVTFISNDTDIILPSGWTKNLNTYYKDFSENMSASIIFIDNANNKTIKQISITNIDIVSPVVSLATYSITNKTKNDVTVTFTSSASDIKTPISWNKSGDKFTKVFSQNTDETISFQDNAGNTTSKNIEITNIDKTAPTVSDAVYSEESSTRDPVIVTFRSDDSDILTPSSWVKSGNNFTKIFTNNTNETVIFQDDVGNQTPKSVIISNIDTSNPNLISFNGKDYIKVTSPKTGKVWLDRNLGANEVCNGSNTSNCSGDYYQWGRKTNGHEKVDSATSSELITNDVESDGKFITSVSSPNHWEDSLKTISLWDGVNASNNICPSGFKVPSKYEFEAEFVKESTVNPDSSFLKITESSYRNNNGSMNTAANNTYLWTSNTDSSVVSFNAFVLKYDTKISYKEEHTTLGIPVRCIKDYDDTTAPTISNIKIGSIALNNADTNVSVTEDITIEFSEEVRAEDIKSTSIVLSRIGSSSKTPIYTNKIATFTKGTYHSLLDRGYEYTLSIKTTIKDIKGNPLEVEKSITFETIPAPDTTLPMIDFNNSTIGSYSSDSKNSNVSVSKNIKISFNESIDNTTINTTNVLLSNTANYSVSLENNKELLITLNSNLSYETTYELVLKQDIQDIVGNALNPLTYGNSAGDKTITFTTEDAPDLTAPQVLSSNPISSSSDVEISANITVTFNEEIKDYDSSSVVLAKDTDNSVISSTLTYSNKILTINPNIDLEENTAYKLTLKTGIKDSSNNALENPIEITFTSGTSSSCSGSVINDICYEISNTKKTWEDAKNTCESENKTLVQKDSISDWVDMASTSKLNLSQDEEYWLFEGESGNYKQATYLRYNKWSNSVWETTTTSNDSQKLYICKKDSVAPTATLTNPTSTSDISTKATLKITFNEAVKNVNHTNIVLKDNMDSIVTATVTYENKVATIKPSDDLNTSTTYTLTLRNDITDLYSNKFEKNIITFTTSSIAETCSGTKLNNICYEKSNTKLTHTIAKNTCEASNKKLVSKNLVSDWTSFANTIELDENTNYWLEEEKYYVRKAYGSWGTTSEYSFSAEYMYICQSEKDAPTLILSEPSNSDTNISTKASIKITFNEEIKESTLISSNIVLKKNSVDSELATTITYANKVATIKPSNDFDTSSTYTLTLKDGITDIYANSLSETTISFTTSDTAYTCSGTIYNDKCYTVFENDSTQSNAKSSCTLINRSDISGNEEALASALSLKEDKKYWLNEDNYVFNKGYFNWLTTTNYSSTNYYICAE